MKILSTVNELVIIIVGSYFLIKSYRTNRNLDILSLFNSSLILYYGLVPFLIKINNFEYVTRYMRTLENVSDYDYFITSFMSMILYLVFIFITYKSINKKKIISNPVYLNNYVFPKKTIQRVAFITMIIGVGSFLLIAYDVGGVITLIRLGDILRSYGKDLGEIINPKLLPFRILMTLILTSPYLFYILNSIEPKLKFKLYFIFSSVFAFIFLIFNAGRAPLLLFIFPFLLNYVFKTKKRPLIFLIGFFLLSIPLISWLDGFFYYLSYGSFPVKAIKVNGLMYFIEQFGYPYVNLINRVKIIEYTGLRLGVDYLTWIINIVPVALLSKVGLYKVQTLNDKLSLFYSGLTSVSELLGGVPIDLFTLGYLQFGFMGSFLLIIVLSKFIKKVNSLIYIDPYIEKTNILYYRISFAMFFWVPNAALDSNIRGKFDIILLIIIVFSIGKYNKWYMNNKAKENYIEK